ncbi:hypothetical protein ACNKHM_07330 [Shigella sonnei]
MPKFWPMKVIESVKFDLAPNPVTQQFINLEATIYFNHGPENVRDASVVVVSSAILPITGNVELMKRVFR